MLKIETIQNAIKLKTAFCQILYNWKKDTFNILSFNIFIIFILNFYFFTIHILTILHF